MFSFAFFFSLLKESVYVYLYVLVGVCRMDTRSHVCPFMEYVQTETQEAGKSGFLWDSCGIFAIYILRVSDFKNHHLWIHYSIM